jgi:hypothetical protein
VQKRLVAVMSRSSCRPFLRPSRGSLSGYAASREHTRSAFQVDTLQSTIPIEHPPKGTHRYVHRGSSLEHHGSLNLRPAQDPALVDPVIITYNLDRRSENLPFEATK